MLESQVKKNNNGSKVIYTWVNTIINEVYEDAKTLAPPNQSSSDMCSLMKALN